VGVLISVTTIPAAGNGALALVFGRFHDAAGSALQLLINLTGIVLAAYLILLAGGRSRTRDDRPERELSASLARCSRPASPPRERVGYQRPVVLISYFRSAFTRSDQRGEPAGRAFPVSPDGVAVDGQAHRD
jgi:hypothetical protein